MCRRLPGWWRTCQVAGVLLWAQVSWAVGATDAVLCESVNPKGLAVGAERWFAAGRDSLTVWFKVGDVPPGSLAEIRWLLNGATLTIREIKLSPPGKSSWCRYSVPEGEKLMPGRYEAQVSVGGKVEARARGQVGGTRPEGDDLAGASGLVRREPTPEVTPAEAAVAPPVEPVTPTPTDAPALALEPERLVIAPQVPLAALHPAEPTPGTGAGTAPTTPPVPPVLAEAPTAPVGGPLAAQPRLTTPPQPPTIPVIAPLPTEGDGGPDTTTLASAPAPPVLPAVSDDQPAVMAPEAPVSAGQRVLMPRASGAATSRPVVTRPRALTPAPQSEVRLRDPVSPAAATHSSLTPSSSHAPAPVSPTTRVTLGGPAPPVITAPTSPAGPTIRRPTADDLAPLPVRPPAGSALVAPAEETGPVDSGTAAPGPAPVTPVVPETGPAGPVEPTTAAGPEPTPTNPTLTETGSGTAPAGPPVEPVTPQPADVLPVAPWVAGRPALAELVAEDLPPVALGAEAVKLHLVTLEALADPAGLQPLWVPRTPDGRLWPPGLPTQLGLFAGASPEPSPASLLLYSDHQDGIAPLYAVPRIEASALADRENDATALTAGRDVYDERREFWQSNARHWRAAWFVREVDLEVGELAVAALTELKRSRRMPEDWQPVVAPETVLLDGAGQRVGAAELTGELLATLASELAGAQAGLPAGAALSGESMPALAAGLKTRGLSGLGVWVAPATGRYQVWSLLPLDACTARSWVWTRAR